MTSAHFILLMCGLFLLGLALLIITSPEDNREAYAFCKEHNGVQVRTIGLEYVCIKPDAIIRPGSEMVGN